MIEWRPGKRPTAIVAPKGRPIAQAMATAVRLTLRLNRTISISLGSAEVISCSACRPAALSVFIRFLGRTVAAHNRL